MYFSCNVPACTESLNSVLVIPIVSELFSNVSTLPKLQKLLQFGIEEGGRIADRASEKLAALRRQVQVMRIERKDQFWRSFIEKLQPAIFGRRATRLGKSVIGKHFVFSIRHTIWLKTFSTCPYMLFHVYWEDRPKMPRW